MANAKSYVNINGEIRDAGITDSSDAPREYRGAWEFDPVLDKININMVTAREIYLGRIRAERKPMLEELDNQWFIANEINDTGAIAQITIEKDALRDAPADARIAAATTHTELTALTLSVLIV